MIQNEIAIRSSAWKEQEEDWHVIRSLLGGTRAMRKAATRYLPREEAESQKSYNARLARSFLYGGFANSVSELASKPFQKPVNVHKGLPEKLTAIEDDVDREGTGFTKFANDVLAEKIAYGKAHILVDTPTKPAANSADESDNEIRPYFVLIRADQVIWWDSEIHNSRRILTDFRYVEDYTDKKLNRRAQRIRRWWVEYDGDAVSAARWEKWEQNQQSKWAIVEEGNNPLKEIPVVVDFACEVDYMTARPPMMEIADLNVAHWQSASDQRNILRFARAPIIWRSGVSAEERDEPVIVGAGASYASVVAGSTMQFVEHGGAAIEAGAKDLKDLEDKMRILALQPMTSEAGNSTATGAGIDEARTNCILKRWIRATEACFKKCYGLAAQWIGKTIADDWKGVDIFDEFGLAVRSAEDIRQLIDLRGKKHITASTELNELKRRGLFKDGFDVDAEIAALEDEGPDLEEIAEIIASARRAAPANGSQPNAPGPNGPSGPPNGPAQNAA